MFDPSSLIAGLAKNRKILRFYDVVYQFLFCSYSRFLEPVIPEDERAPLPVSVLERMASGNRFEAAQVARLIATQVAAGNPVVLASGEFWVLDPGGDVPGRVKALTVDAPAHRSFGLVADGVFHPLPEDGRKRSSFCRRVADGVQQLLLYAADDYHVIEEKSARDALRDDVCLRTVSALAEGVAAMKEGRPAPVIVAPRLPRTYVEELDMDLVGEPDLLVPVPSLATYTAVDYKDSNPLSSSTRTQQFLCSEASSPFFDEAKATDIGPGVLNKKHRLQLFHYQLMLEPLLEALGTKATSWAGIIGRGELVVWSDQTEKTWGRGKKSRLSAEEIYFKVVSESLDAEALGELHAAGADVELPAELGPALRAECAECPFRRHCEQERRRNGGHLTLHPDISASEALELAEVLPAPTLESLAFSDAESLTAKAVVRDVRGFGRSPEDIHARFEALIDGARAIHVTKSYRRRDQSRIPTLEAVIEAHVDLENNNNPMADGRVPANYWFQTGWTTKRGVDDLSDSVSTRYQCKFAYGSPEEEAEMFASFWSSMRRLQSEASRLYDEIRDSSGASELKRIKASGGAEALEYASQRLGARSSKELKVRLGEGALAGIVPFRAFVYSPAEYRIMRAKARQHEGFPGVPSVDEVVAWFATQSKDRPESAVAVDLCKFLEVYVHLPLQDRKLKTVGPYVGHQWPVDDPNGLAATYKADVLLSNPDSGEAEEARRWLRAYNKADCDANLAIRRWIDAIRWKGVEQLDAEGVFRARFPRRAARRNRDLTLFDASS